MVTNRAGAVAGLRSASSVLRDRSLRGARARFGCFLVFGALLCLPSILFSRDSPVGARLLGLAALCWLLAGRWREYHRERLAPPWWDLADAAALLAVIAPGGPGPVAALLFGMVCFRALFDTGRRVAFSLCLYAATFVVGAEILPGGGTYPVDMVAGSTVGVLIVGYLMYTLRVSLTAREDALRSEHEAAVRSERFLTAVLDNLTDGVAACDAKGKITVFNDEVGALHPQAHNLVTMENWARVYGLYCPDGVTPLAPDHFKNVNDTLGHGDGDALLCVVAERTIGLDDFGTGYSSLGRLRAFPFRVVKIDKSFVAEIDQGKPAVVEAALALALARSLGLETVAQGVETRHQLDALIERGCEGVQGYLLSPPVPPQRLTDILAAQRSAGLAGGSRERPDETVTAGAQPEIGAA